MRQDAIILRRTVNLASQLKAGLYVLEPGQWGYATDDFLLVLRDLSGNFHEIPADDALVNKIQATSLIKEPVATMSMLPSTASQGTLILVEDTSTWYYYNNAWQALSSGSTPTTAPEKSTGLLTWLGTKFTKVDATHVAIAAGTGQIVDVSGNVSAVSFSGGSSILDQLVNTASNTYYMVNAAGVIVQQATYPTPQQLRENIYLGFTAHAPFGTITVVTADPCVAFNELSQVRDMLDAVGIINRDVRVTANAANLTIKSSAGYLYRMGIGFVNNTSDPSRVAIAAQTPGTFQYRTQTGVATANLTSLEVGYYDVGGVRTPVGSNKYTSQRVYISPSGVLRVAYGQVLYNSLAACVAAISTEAYVPYAPFKTNFVLIGIISVGSNATNLQDSAQALFSNVSIFGESIGIGSGVGVTTLQQAYDNGSEPEIVTNTTRGAVSIKRGSSADTDNVLEIQNGSGISTTVIKGNGAITAGGGGVRVKRDVADETNSITQLILGEYNSITDWKAIIESNQITGNDFFGIRLKQNGGAGATDYPIKIQRPTGGLIEFFRPFGTSQDVYISSNDTTITESEFLLTRSIAKKSTVQVTTADTNQQRPVLDLNHKTSATATGDLGVILTASYTDATGTYKLGAIDYVRAGVNLGDFYLQSYKNTAYVNILRGRSDGKAEFFGSLLLNSTNYSASQYLKTDASKNVVSQNGIPWGDITDSTHAASHAGTGDDPITSLGAVTFTGDITANDSTRKIYLPNAVAQKYVSGTTQDWFALYGGTVTPSSANWSLAFKKDGTDVSIHGLTQARVSANGKNRFVGTDTASQILADSGYGVTQNIGGNNVTIATHDGSVGSFYPGVTNSTTLGRSTDIWGKAWVKDFAISGYVEGNLTGITNGTYNLGDSTHQWQNLWMSNAIYFGSGSYYLNQSRVGELTNGGSTALHTHAPSTPAAHASSHAGTGSDPITSLGALSITGDMTFDVNKNLTVGGYVAFSGLRNYLKGEAKPGSYDATISYGHINPQATNAMLLGDSTARWSKLYTNEVNLPWGKFQDWAGNTSGNEYCAIYGGSVTPGSTNAALMAKFNATATYINAQGSVILSYGGASNLYNRLTTSSTDVKLFHGTTTTAVQALATSATYGVTLGTNANQNKLFMPDSNGTTHGWLIKTETGRVLTFDYQGTTAEERKLKFGTTAGYLQGIFNADGTTATWTFTVGSTLSVQKMNVYQDAYFAGNNLFGTQGAGRETIFWDKLIIPSFATTTARDLMIPTPGNGQICCVVDQSRAYCYVNGAWRALN